VVAPGGVGGEPEPLEEVGPIARTCRNRERLAQQADCLVVGREGDRALFFNLAKKMRATEEDRQQLTEKDFMIIVPAFVVSELKEAFQIGFLLFVPFIVIDMVVANILLALGMQMLSPTTISMPFKLLLFVVVDGWYLIAKGLVVGYL